MKKKINIAIIDNGINDKIISEKVQSYYVHSGVVEPTQPEVVLNHATMIAYIIDKNCKNCKFTSIKIMKGKKKDTSIKKLIIALEWCLYNYIDIINLSIGTVNFYDSLILKPTIEKLVTAGIIIVAAQSNSNRITYPAAFPDVIGVKFDWMQMITPTKYYFNANNWDGIETIVNYNNILQGNEIEQCNSYAVPHITAYICDMLKMGVRGLANIKEELRQNSSSIHLRENDVKWNVRECVEKPFIFLKIKSDKINVEDFLKAIVLILRKKYYNITIISEHIQYPYLSIFKTSGSQLNSENFQKKIFDATQPDLLLLCGLNVDDTNYKKYFDMFVKVEKGKYFVEYQGKDAWKIVEKQSDLRKNSAIEEIVTLMVDILKQ